MRSIRADTTEVSPTRRGRAAQRCDDDDIVSINHLFVYGTLRPGDVRWPLLRPFVNGDALADEADGALYDTGLEYPAAVFGGTSRIIGDTFELITDMIDHALAVLDVEEDTVEGLYRRVAIRTRGGRDAWAYEYGAGLELTPIESGDWFVR
jgi:gamma-glutamylcyclotransferase (GGCT)/AIG2-like uncharacterized protein YtfP